MLVAEHLDLHVAGPDHGFLQDQFAAAEGVLRLGARRLQCHRHVVQVLHQAHAAPAATGGRLDHDRRADLLRRCQQGVVGLVLGLVAGYAGYVRLQHAPLGGRLVAHDVDGSRCRADKHDTRLGAGTGERGVLRQEAVARVNRLGAGLASRLENLVRVQVGLLDRRRADQDRLVRHQHVGRFGVRLGVDGDGAIALLLGGADDPHGNLAAVGHQDAVEVFHKVDLVR